jgi:adenylosuccinate lyase
LIERIIQDQYFKPIHLLMDELLEPSTFTGLASEQTKRFIDEEVRPALNKYESKLQKASELNV